MIVFFIILVICLGFFSMVQKLRSKSPESYTAIIVEPRKHVALSFVIENALQALDERWTIILYHGTENGDWAKTQLANVLAKYKNRVSFHNLGIANLPNARSYSELFMTREFLETIPTEIFLVFQTDSMFCSVPAKLDRFMKYDFVGAPVRGEHGEWMNGGFSLRRRTKMLEILDKCSQSESAKDFEDLFFSQGCGRAKPRLPDFDSAAEFSIQAMLPKTGKSIGCHKAYLEQEPEAIKQVCPGIETLQMLNS